MSKVRCPSTVAPFLVLYLCLALASPRQLLAQQDIPPSPVAPAATNAQLFLPIVTQASRVVQEPVAWQTYVDPLYGFRIAIPSGWFVAPTDPGGVLGAAVITNYSLNEPLSDEALSPERIKIQIGVAPLAPDESLDEWVARWRTFETLGDHNGGAVLSASAVESSQVGPYTAMSYTIEGSNASPNDVYELNIQLDDRQVMVVGISPADSTLASLALQILSNLEFDPMLTFAPEVLALAESFRKADAPTRGDPMSAALASCPVGAFTGDEAPNSPIPLFMPFLMGETWTVGGPGSFYGNGAHCNGNSIYYSTDWNKYNDAGAAVLPVADGTISGSVPPTCPETGYGCYVQVDHGSGIRTLYAHLTTVMRTAGPILHTEQIGTVGTTGFSTAPHLHLTFQKKDGTYYQSNCWNGGATCANGDAPRSPQSPKPSPMQSATGLVALRDNLAITSNNGNGGVDTTPPSGAISTPSEGATITGRAVRLEGTAADSGSGVDHARFTAKWSGSWHDLGTDMPAPAFAYDWDMCAAGVPDGQVEIGFDIWDKAGNGASSPSGVRHVIKNYDCNQLPAVPTLQNPGNGATLTEGESSILAWAATGSDYFGEVWGGPGGTQTFGWQTGASKDLGAQPPGYVYSWHVKARKPGGSSAWSDTRTYVVKPRAPTNLAAAIASCSQVSLTWTDNSGGEGGYRISRNGFAVGAVGANGAGYQDMSALDGEMLSYGVQAFRGEVYSEEARIMVKTPQCSAAPTVPIAGAPANGAVFNEGERVVLNWNTTAVDSLAELWNGWAGTSTFGWQGATSVDLGAVPAGYVYSWRVKGRNSVGESSFSATRSFTVKPLAPDRLTAVNGGCGQINLAWVDRSANEEGYRVYRSGALIGQVGMNGATYQDSGLAGGQTYAYQVRAYRGSVESDAASANVPLAACKLADLAPTHLPMWEFPIVPAPVKETTRTGNLTAGQATYVDWGLTNLGNAPTSGASIGRLLIDGQPVHEYNYGNVGSGEQFAFFDFAIMNRVPGAHMLRMEADPGNLIAESNEGNNSWEREFTWQAPPADSLEPDNTAAAARALTANTAQSHSISPAGDVDWLTFTLGQQSGVLLSTKGDFGDTRMWLFDQQMRELSFNDDLGPDARFAAISRTCGANALPAGVYKVKVDEYNRAKVIAQYTLLLEVTPCPPSGSGEPSTEPALSDEPAYGEDEVKPEPYAIEPIGTLPVLSH